MEPDSITDALPVTLTFLKKKKKQKNYRSFCPKEKKLTNTCNVRLPAVKNK